MMVRSMPIAETSTRGVACLVGALAAVSLGIFAVASAADESPSMLQFLARAQSQANAQGAATLINAVTPDGSADDVNTTTVSKTIATKARAGSQKT